MGNVICPNMRKTDIFHHQNMAHTSHMATLPIMYFWAALKHTPSHKKYYPDVSHLVDEVPKREILFKIVIVPILDELLSKIIPTALFGTRNLEVWQAFFFKNIPLCFVLSSVAIS